MLVNVCHNKCRGIFFLVLTSEGVILPLFIFLYLISLFLPLKIKSKNLEFTFFTGQELQPKGAAKAKQGREQRCSKILLIWGSLSIVSAAVPARDCPCSRYGIGSGPDLTSARPLVQDSRPVTWSVVPRGPLVASWCSPFSSWEETKTWRGQMSPGTFCGGAERHGSTRASPGSYCTRSSAAELRLVSSQ